MQRFILPVLMVFCLTAFSASAKDMADKYVDANLPDLTRFSAHYNTINLQDPTSFSEYLKVTECSIFTSVTSQFKQQEIQQAYINHLAKTKMEDTELFFRIPVTFVVSDYNFDTQSLTIVPYSQFIRVNVLELIPPKTPTCGTETTNSLTRVPALYNAKLNFPITLVRIPLQKNVAENIMSRLARDYSNNNLRVVYGNILLQIEAIQPETKTVLRYTQGIVRGQVNAIDLYVDAKRKIMFKRLDYAEGF